MNNPNSDNRQGIFEVSEIIAEKFDGKKTLDISSITVSLNITVALNYNCISGSIMIVDSANLLNNNRFSFTGEEFIKITIKKQNSDTKFSYKFVAPKMDTEIKSVSVDSSIFNLTLMSVDNFINAGVFKSKSYRGKGSDIVKGILNQELNTEIKINDDGFEESDGDLVYAFTKIKPFEKIDILKNQVYKNKPVLTSTYMFYENRKGYNFETFEKIMERAAANTNPIEYKHSPLGSLNRETNFNTILNFNPKGTFDNFRRMYHGLYNTEMLIYDFATNSITSDSFNILDNIDTIQTINKADPGASDNFRKDASNLGSFTYFYPQDSTRTDYTPKSTLHTSPFSILLGENMLMIKTFGNLDLEVGDPINVKILDNITPSDEHKDDPRYSGKYIIYAITYDLGIENGGYRMYNNMLLIRDGSLRDVNFYNSLYGDANSRSIIPALGGSSNNQTISTNDTLILGANSVNQTPGQ